MNTKEKTFQKTWVVCLLALICCALWGSAFPFIKIGYSLFAIDSADTASQILFAGIRFFLAGVFAIVLASAAGRKILLPTKSSLPKIGIISMFQTVMQYFFFYVGLAHTTGVNASIIEAANVFLAIFISSLIFRQESLDAKKIFGCIVGFAGVVLVNIRPGSAMHFNLLGDGFILISAATYACSSVFLKHYSASENPVMLSGYQFMFGGIVMAIPAYLLGGRLGIPSAKAVCLLVYLALVSAVSYSIWGMLLKYNRVSRVTVYGFMNPVFGVILSAILLREGQTFGIAALAALVLVCAGIYIVNRDTKN